MKRAFIDESGIIRKPSENLAINEYCAELVSSGDYEFIARVYTHDKGVIIGANESLLDVNTGACEELGYEVVRRPSGGSLIITSPELTLCYSLFFKSRKKSLEETYKSIVMPLAKSLGEGFSVNERYSYSQLMYDGKPIAGHAIKSSGGVTQFDGVINLESLEIILAKKLFHLRTLYQGDGFNFILMNGKTYDLKGRLINVDVNGSKLLMSEEQELKGLTSLIEAGLNKDYFISRLRGLFPDALVSEFDYSKNFIDYQVNEINEKINEGVRAGLGHCFIGLLEPEH